MSARASGSPPVRRNSRTKPRGGKEAAQVGEQLLFVKLRQGGALGAELFAVGALAGAARGDAEAHAAQEGPVPRHTGGGEAVRRAANAQSEAAHNGGAQAAEATARPALAGAVGPGRLRRGQHAHAPCPGVVEGVVAIARRVPRLQRGKHVADAALHHARAVRRAGGVVPAGVDGDDALAADDGERVLVLIAQLVLEALQRLHAAAVKVDLAPLGEVAQKHAGVEHHADGHAEDLAHALGGGRVCGHRAQQRISHVHGEKVGDVLQDDDCRSPDRRSCPPRAARPRP